MVSQNSEQRQLYDARLKFQRDEAARLELALSEGIEKGIEKGSLLGRISLLQELLGVAESNRQELASYTEAQLSELVEQLKHQLRTRSV